MCVFFSSGNVKCATLEDIEAEKSLIEKNVVSLSVMYVFVCCNKVVEDILWSCSQLADYTLCKIDG